MRMNPSPPEAVYTLPGNRIISVDSRHNVQGRNTSAKGPVCNSNPLMPSGSGNDSEQINRARHKVPCPRQEPNQQMSHRSSEP
jgi:hypothetical protein